MRTLYLGLVLSACTGDLGVPPSGDPPGGDAAGSGDASPGDNAVPGDPSTQLVTSVTDHGITWTFAAPAQVGEFITGDTWVVGPVTVTGISPAPANDRNGSVVNVPPNSGDSPWDDRVESGRYEPSWRVSPPVALTAGNALVSSISVATPGLVDNWLREGNGEQSSSPVASISVLTCVAAPPPADAFRPSYAGGWTGFHRLSDINRSLLTTLAPPSALETSYIQMFTDRMSRPWVDSLMYSFDAQVESMPMYGREMGRVVGITSLMLLLDLPVDQQTFQERLLIGFVQHGIDLFGLVREGHPGWHAHGGHGSGRKAFIVVAGVLLGDAAMASPTVTYPDVKFGEDMHTAFASEPPYGPAWNGATVIYTGHMGIWNGEIVSSTSGWGPYEHLPPDQWVLSLGEGYRRCCTSLAWVGQALTVRLLDAQTEWNHDAFFAYVDRWMDATGDAAYTQTIYELKGENPTWDYRSSWQAHGQAWDDFVEEMWATYR